MRRLTILTLLTTFALVACGDDPEPEGLLDRPDQPSAADTMAADTAAADTMADASAGPAGSDGVAGGATGGAAAGAGGAASADAADTGTAGGADDAAPGARGVRPEGRLYTVQVGAFLEQETAQVWQERLASQGLPVWISIAELGGQTFYRLRVGAVPTVAEARRLGTRLTGRYDWPVWVAPLTPADRMPQGAVEETRRILQGD